MSAGVDPAVRKRAFALRARMAACDLCPRACGVDRLRGERGFCRTADTLPVAHIGLHHGEEPPISGTRGSGTIFFARCNARCVYCQNYQISQRDRELAVRDLSPAALAGEMMALQARGAHNVNLVSPTHVAAGVARALCIARARGLRVPVVYNTGGYEAVETLRALEGLVDVYLPDIKYSEDQWAAVYSQLPHYVSVNRAAIAEMYHQVGDLTLDAEGIARRGLLVRHLVLPADRAGSRASLAFLASLSRQMVISLMAQYAPHHRARSMPPLDRPITAAEYERVLDAAWSLGLERCFVQALESGEAFVPDFRARDPFA